MLRWGAVLFAFGLVAACADHGAVDGGLGLSPLPSTATPSASDALPPAPVSSACPPDRSAGPATIRVDTVVGVVWFCDSADCESGECRRFRLLAEERERYVFVAAEFYEGSAVYAVDRVTSEVRALNAAPRFNPSGNLFATSSLDEMSGSPDTDGLFLWSFDDVGRIRQAWHLRTEDLADAEIVGWADDHCLNVRGFLGWGTGRHTPVHPFFIEGEGDGKWRLAPGSCESRGD